MVCQRARGRKINAPQGTIRNHYPVMCVVKSVCLGVVKAQELGESISGEISEKVSPGKSGCGNVKELGTPVGTVA
jgi:hypothetical protein